MIAEIKLIAHDRATIETECKNCVAEGFMVAEIASSCTVHCLRPVYRCDKCCETFLAVHRGTWLHTIFLQNVKEVFGEKKGDKK